MQTGYYATTGGMVTQFNRVENITNNLANINTNAYKEQKQVVGDFLRLYQEKRDELPLHNHTKEGAKFVNRTMARVPQIVESFTDFKLGAFAKTDNKLDFSLSNNSSFFAVQTPNGVRLTRDGSFTLNEQGNLTTKEGFLVLGGESIAEQELINFEDNSNIVANRDGALFENGEETGNLLVVQPNNLKTLKKVGDNLYSFENEADLNVQTVSNAVRQGYLEKSNVNAVIQMVALIDANRLVGMYQKAMDTQMNELNRDAVEKLATTRV